MTGFHYDMSKAMEVGHVDILSWSSKVGELF